MKKGINAWSFGKMKISEILSLAKKAGFEGVELNLGEEGELSLESSREEIEEIANLAKGLNLELPSLSTGLHWKYSLSSLDLRLREKGMEIVERMLEDAAILGADTILVVPGLVTEEADYDYVYKASQESLNNLVPLASECKVCIGIENVWNKFLLSPLEFKRFIDEVSSPYLAAYFDLGNVLIFGYPEQWIEILGKRIKKVHIKDFITKIGNISGFTNLLEGDINWRKVILALKKINYQSYLTAELTPYSLYPEKLIYDTSSSMDLILERSKENA